MEIMKSNLPHSLNMNNTKRHSYIKPPIPPKPKIIPKPKHLQKVNVSNSQSLHLLQVDDKCNNHVSALNSNCDRLNSKSDDNRFSVEQNIIKECEIKNISDNLHTLYVSCARTPYSPTCHSDSPETVPYINISIDSTDDVSSSLMERTLEDCVRLSSKSSSDTSISLGDSDSDEFLPTKDAVFSSESGLEYPPSPNAPSDDILPIVLCDNNNLDATINIEDNRKRKAFLVAREIKTSEESFVRILKLLNEDFKEFLMEKGCVNTSSKPGDKSHRSDSIPEKDLHQIFKYLPNLQNLNQEILTDFEARITGWDTNAKIADVIVRKGPFLKLYANYIRELECHTLLLQECSNRYSFFGECLKEFESSPASRLIPVSKHMLTPMQRITKYKELMKQYLKYLNEDSLDYADALLALEIVQGVAEHANEAIRELENSARLLCLQERLNGISTAEPSAATSTGNLQHLLVEPGRRLLMEGQLMKLCRRGIRVVYLILLSDSLLYTMQELHGGKNCPLKLRYRLPLEGMRVDIPVSEDFQTEFTVISTSRSFTVRASCTRERDQWLRALQSAIESNANRRFSFEKAKTAEFEVLAANVLGKQAPAWIPDNRVTMCQVCTSEFSLTFRRHHCRACGKVVCRHCSSNRAPLAYLDHHTERVCDTCFEELQKGVEEMERKGEEEIEDEEMRRTHRRSMRVIRGRFKRGLKETRKSKVKKPERLLEVCGGDHESQICGYLRHYSRRTWRQSWFVLKDKVLYEYRAPEDVCALSSLPILGYSVNTHFNSLDIFDGMDVANAFQLIHLNQPFHSNQHTPSTPPNSNQHALILYAESNELALKWRAVMEKEVYL